MVDPALCSGSDFFLHYRHDMMIISIAASSTMAEHTNRQQLPGGYGSRYGRQRYRSGYAPGNEGRTDNDRIFQGHHHAFLILYQVLTDLIRQDNSQCLGTGNHADKKGHDPDTPED